MDTIAETGSRWFCAAAQAVATPSLEMQMCGASSGRYAIGLATVFAGTILAIVLAWRLAERRAG